MNAFDLLVQEQNRNPSVIEGIETLPDFQHPDGDLDDCEDCGQPTYQCVCADLCQWTSYDGAPKCREAKDDYRDEFCREHDAEAMASKYDDDWDES